MSETEAVSQPLSADLLEKNALQLAALEEEWAELGPQRQFDFTCSLPDRERAMAFCQMARQAGFSTKMSPHGDAMRVIASIVLAPDAVQLTARQQQLQSYLETDPSAPPGVDGWAYPPKLRVSFWPKQDHFASAEARASVLFGSDLVRDTLKPFVPSANCGFTDAGPPTFRVEPKDFLARARSMRPAYPQPTASGFAQWIYSLYRQAEGTDDDKARGRAAEQDIWDRRLAAVGANDETYLRKKGLDWRLIHNGLSLRDRSTSRHLLIPALRVRGEPLRVSPDLMYANHDQSRVLIVEIKFSRQVIPRNLWPNVWGQLWCYAQLDVARKAGHLTVVGEVWAEEWTRKSRTRSGYEPAQMLVTLRSAVRRDPRSAAYDRFFRQLFDIYAGAN
jgi:hypothetical protein